MKRICKITGICLLILVILVAAYVAYVFIDYHRIEDRQVLPITITPAVSAADPSTAHAQDAALPAAPVNQPLSVTAWNIGFGAYTADYSFFMDGGKYSRGFSKDAVRENITAIGQQLSAADDDFYLIQEVDLDATRSYHLDQREMLAAALPGRASTFAVNYDSPYLFWPLIKPHGKSLAGLYILSDYAITDGLRRSLPIQDGFSKFIDLDRCYAINRIPTADGKTLVLVNVHLSAYTTDPTIAEQQLHVLYEDLQAEVHAGNYVLCGGDFNKDLLGDSAQYFGVAGEDYSWAKPFPVASIPDGLRLIAPLDKKAPVPSCRNADRPWDPATNFQLTIDGFLVSDNIDVLQATVTDTQFTYSDHNPVKMTFRLTP